MRAQLAVTVDIALLVCIFFITSSLSTFNSAPIAFHVSHLFFSLQFGLVGSHSIGLARYTSINRSTSGMFTRVVVRTLVPAHETSTQQRLQTCSRVWTSKRDTSNMNPNMAKAMFRTCLKTCFRAVWPSPYTHAHTTHRLLVSIIIVYTTQLTPFQASPMIKLLSTLERKWALSKMYFSVKTVIITSNKQHTAE